MKYLPILFVIFCFISCNSPEERKKVCDNYLDEIEKHRKDIFEHHIELMKHFYDAEESSDTATMNDLQRKIKVNNASLDSIQEVIWKVRDSCHNITCILKSKQ